ncbi:MAG: D-alanyl-D-alanine carboxypeptidase family protein [archaeon]
MKAHFFLPAVVIMVIIALFTAWALLSSKYDSPQNAAKAIGTKQAALINAYLQGSEAQTYLDIATPHALDYAISEMADNGGIMPGEDGGGSPCGEYMYNLWNGQGNDCTPDIPTSLAEFFNNALDPFLSNHKRLISLSDPFITFTLQKISELPAQYRIFATAIQPLIIPLGAGKLEQSLRYISSSLTEAIAIYCPTDNELVPIENVRCTAGADGCRVLPEVEKKIQETAQLLKEQGLPNGQTYELVIVSGFRSLEKQKSIWRSYCPNEPFTGRCSGVAQPRCGTPDRPITAPHMTGGAIDIALYDASDHEVNLGPRGASYTYAKYSFTDEQCALQNQLEDFMCDIGWVRYGEEWWHFEYGTRMWDSARKQNLCEQGRIGRCGAG